MDIHERFAKRRKALKKGDSVYVGYDEYERIYKFTSAPYNGVRVYFKERDGRTGTLNYNISEDAKEALFRGWDITEEDYENCIYEMPEDYKEKYYKTDYGDQVVTLRLSREQAVQILKGKMTEVFFPFKKWNIKLLCRYFTDKEGNLEPRSMLSFDRIRFKDRYNNWYLEVKPGMYGLYQENEDGLSIYPYLSSEKPEGKFIFMFKIHRVVETNLEPYNLFFNDNGDYEYLSYKEARKRMNISKYGKLWENIEEKYPIGSKHTAKVVQLKGFGAFVELKDGVRGVIHSSNFSWVKKIKHPSEFTNIGDYIDVVVLGYDHEKLVVELGHKQLFENPWDTYEKIYIPDSIHKGKIIEIKSEKAKIILPGGLIGVSFLDHLIKEDGTIAQLGEELPFMVLHFDKDKKHIKLSHKFVYTKNSTEI